MRKTKTVKIDDREITVRELRVKDIRQILEAMEKAEEGDFTTEVERFLPLATDIDRSVLEEMAPSELKTLWKAFAEVNADFLSAIERLGIAEALKSSIRKHLTDSLADLSRPDTAAPGTTAGASF